MKNDFTHLHLHSDFSLLDGMCKLSDLFKQAKEFGMSSVAITDHGNMSCYVKALKAAKDHGVNYIPGTEFYIIDNVSDKKSARNHLVVWARNRKGASLILKMLGDAYKNFYHRPLIDYNILAKYASKDLIVSTACAAGILSRKDRDKRLYQLKDMFKHMFIEVMPHEFDQQKVINKVAETYSYKLSCPIIATNDAHYLKQEHSESHEILLAINTNARLSDKKRYKFDGDTYYFCNKKEFIELFERQGVFKRKQILRYIENTKLVEELIDFESFKKHDIDIEIEGYDKEKFLSLVKKSFKKFAFNDDEEYRNRLKRELQLIMKKGFDRYFYVVWDFIQFAKRSDIMIGPGRGSVGGSLLAYVLGITNVNPIKFNLSFERFIAEDRTDFPDIDLDFEDARRDEVLVYLKNKYGEKCVANISTFTTLKPKMVLRDVARVCELDMREVTEVTKTMDGGKADSLKVQRQDNEQLSGYLRKYKKYKTHYYSLENVARNIGKHAAGCVITNEDINNSGRGYVIERDGKAVLNWDKDDAEFQGFIKFDLLGLNNLTIMKRCLQFIKERHNIEVDLDKIKLTDKKTLDVFAKGDTLGVFQFASYGIRKYLEQMKVDSFQDLVNMNALYRPGTLHSGIMDKYVDIKNGHEKPFYYDSKGYKQATKETFGLIVFQEQLINVLLAFGFEYAEADKLRKIMSKSKGVEEMQKYEDDFMKKAVKSGVSKDNAKELFEQIKFFGGYAFNLSHSTSYSIISFWTAYLKAHYYDCYMQACLSYANGDDKKQEFINDLLNKGYRINNVNFKKSKAYIWIVEDGEVYLPFIALKQIGEKAAIELEDIRKRSVMPINNMQQLSYFANKRVINSRTLSILEKVDVFNANSKLKNTELYSIDMRL